jgi:uncharacterized alpha-E superfamily protein
VADVWVVGHRPAAAVSLLPAAGAASLVGARVEDALPSRAADNLLWLGRYVERAEGLLRLARAGHARAAEGAEPALVAAVHDLLDAYGADGEEAVPEGILETLGAAVRAASRVRDRLSPDASAALADLQRSMVRMGGTARPGADAASAIGALLRKAAGFAGLVHENMARGDGWQFLQLGRALERAGMTADLLAALADPGAPPGALDLALEAGDSVMTHRWRHALLASRASVLDVLALDGTNPRALRAQAGVMVARVAALGEDLGAPALGAALDAHTPLSLDTGALRAWRGDVLGLSDAVHEAFLR